MCVFVCGVRCEQMYLNLFIPIYACMFQAAVTYVSTYVLVSLSLDRYDAVARPMNFSRSRKLYSDFVRPLHGAVPGRRQSSGGWGWESVGGGEGEGANTLVTKKIFVVYSTFQSV